MKPMRPGLPAAVSLSGNHNRHKEIAKLKGPDASRIRPSLFQLRLKSLEETLERKELQSIEGFGLSPGVI